MSDATRAKEVAQEVVQRHFPQWNPNVDGTDESLAYPLARSLTAAFTTSLNAYAAEQTAALRELTRLQGEAVSLARDTQTLNEAEIKRLLEENARLRGELTPYLFHLSTCRSNVDERASVREEMCSCGLRALLADPKGQREGEEWRALEQENESLRAVMRDVAGNCEELARMEGIEKAEQRTWQSIASRLRSVAVERARQAP